MNKSVEFRWFLSGAFTSLFFVAFTIYATIKFTGTTRPAGPPRGIIVEHPWGAINIDEMQNEETSELERSIANSFTAESPEDFDINDDGIREYNLLALSGGGSNGAFGAGVLCGWTKAGNRPDFKVVTGVSAGALQATAAFLGAEYDEILKEINTEYSTEDIYTKRNPLQVIAGDAVYDTTPLKEMIDHYINRKILDAVAARHNSGRRLFIGTTNMDTQEFVIWDMGKIASSEDRNSLELYRKVLLASASVPVVFPPVYFEVESNGKIYHEMHCDGGAFAQVFFRGFLLNFDEALDEYEQDPSKFKISLYVINNGISFTGRQRHEVKPRTAQIAGTTIRGLFNITIASSLYRMYVLASRNDVSFNIAAIEEDSDLLMEPLIFDKEKQQKLFDYGFIQAEKGYEWLNIPPGIDTVEIFEEQVLE